jgi:C1A family cysteine protease
VAFGWDDDYSHGGSLRVQNSFGGRWGSGGWGYLPYSIVKDSWTGSAWKRRDNGTSGNPWFRFFSMEYRG